MSRKINASIMIVDDQPANLKLLQAMLGGQTYELRRFRTGRLAVTRAVQRPPDLILLDIRMPDMDGFQVFDRLRAHPPLSHVPVIFVSGANDIEHQVRAFQCGAVDFIAKPFQRDELRLRVEKHLQAYRMQCAQRQHADELEELIRLRTRDVEESRVEVLHRLAIAAEYRDRDTGTHTRRVGQVSGRLAQVLGVARAEMELIRLAAPLHDLGKIGIPDGILLAERRLTKRSLRL